MRRKPRPTQTLHAGQVHNPVIKKARAKHKEFLRDSDEKRAKSLRSAGDQKWPLIAAEMESQRLCTRTVLDNPSKQILFKLSHPDFDWDALEAAIQRDAEGVALTDEEKKALIDRAQGQADELSGLTGWPTENSFDGVSQEAIEFTRSLDTRRRYLVWAAYQRANLDETADVEGNEIVRVYREWKAEKMFYVCMAMEKLIADLNSMAKVQIDELRSIYQADRLPLGSPNWKGRKPNMALAAAIITASATNEPDMPYRAEPNFASILVKAYDRYLRACTTIDRKHPKAYNANHLKIMQFLRGV